MHEACERIEGDRDKTLLSLLLFLLILSVKVDFLFPLKALLQLFLGHIVSRTYALWYLERLLLAVDDYLALGQAIG